MLLEKDYPIDEVVFADTKYEFPEMYDHIEKVRLRLEKDYPKVLFITLRTTQSFEKWFYGEYTRGKSKGQRRGFPKVVLPCYWSRESKYLLLEKYMKDSIRYIGIASDEPKRYKEANLEKGYRYPLYDWGVTEAQCLQYLKDNDLLSPIHLMFKRTGCWWCPKQSRGSLLTLCENYPDLWKQLKKWEADSPEGFKPDIKLRNIEKECENEKRQLNWFDKIEGVE